MKSPYNERNYYTFNAVTIQVIEIEEGLVKKASEAADFWGLVNSISSQFAEIARRGGVSLIKPKTNPLVMPELSQIGYVQVLPPTDFIDFHSNQELEMVERHKRKQLNQRPPRILCQIHLVKTSWMECTLWVTNQVQHLS